MPRYFFNTKAGGPSTLDAFGLDLKDDAAAREALTRALALDPDSSEARELLTKLQP